MSDWKKFYLEQVSEFITKGSTPTTFGFKWVESGIPFLRSECVTDEGFNKKGLSFINEEAHNYMERSKVISGDILISITGNVGRIAIFPLELKEGNINQHIARVRINNFEVCEKKFIYYQLVQDSYRQYCNGIVTGAAYPQLSLKQIRETPVYLPSLPTQRQISAILSSYDDLIENNLKRIKLLYEAAQLLYDKLINEEKEFKTVELEGISNYLGRGVTPQYQDGSSFFAINQKANKGLFLEEQYFKEYKIGDWVPKEKFAMNGDVLINCLGEGTIGRCHFFKGEDNKYPVDQHMTIFRGKTKEISLFVFQFLDSELGQGLLYSLKKGGTNMTMLNISDLRSLKIDLPIDRILSNHYIITESLFRQKAILEKQNQKLKESRDILLPRLMNGTINVE